MTANGSIGRLTPEAVASWYFRLNGCLQIENFIVHPDPDCDPSENQARTDADLIGVRMPWRTELGMEDDQAVFKDQNGKTLIYFAEVKAGKRCTINGPWSKPPLQNLPRALRAIGCVPDEQVDDAVEKLYKSCYYEGERVLVRMMAVGEKINPIYQNSKPNVAQITWHHALTFIHQRFSQYRVCKTDNQHWPETGHILWKLFETSDRDKFVQKALTRFKC